MLSFRVENLNSRLHHVCRLKRPEIDVEQYFELEDSGKIEFAGIKAEVHFPVGKQSPAETENQYLVRNLGLAGLIMAAGSYDTIRTIGLNPERVQGHIGMDLIAKKHFRMRAAATGCLIGYYSTTTAAFAVPATTDPATSSKRWNLDLPTLTDDFENLLLEGCSAWLDLEPLTPEKNLVKLSISFNDPLPLPI